MLEFAARSNESFECIWDQGTPGYLSIARKIGWLAVTFVRTDKLDKVFLSGKRKFCELRVLRAWSGTLQNWLFTPTKIDSLLHKVAADFLPVYTFWDEHSIHCGKAVDLKIRPKLQIFIMVASNGWTCKSTSGHAVLNHKGGAQFYS